MSCCGRPCVCVWPVLPAELSPDDLMLLQPEALVWPPSDFLLTSPPLQPSCLFLPSHPLLPKPFSLPSPSARLLISRLLTSPKISSSPISSVYPSSFFHCQSDFPQRNRLDLLSCWDKIIREAAD